MTKPPRLRVLELKRRGRLGYCLSGNDLFFCIVKLDYLCNFAVARAHKSNRMRRNVEFVRLRLGTFSASVGVMSWSSTLKAPVTPAKKGIFISTDIERARVAFESACNFEHACMPHPGH